VATPDENFAALVKYVIAAASGIVVFLAGIVGTLYKRSEKHWEARVALFEAKIGALEMKIAQLERERDDTRRQLVECRRAAARLARSQRSDDV